MPFTFSHPAIILPLRYLPKSWFSLTALIIGSLTPDFEYFLRMKVKSDYSHTLTGIFWFDLPLALFLAFIFHNLTRNLLFENLPSILRNRIQVYTNFNWNAYFRKNWPIVSLSLLIGIISHVFWDAFTHRHGYFVNQIDWLENNLFVLGKEIPFWKIVQHISSLTGGFIILVTLFRLPQKHTSKTFSTKLYWITVLLFTFTILFTRFTINPKILNIGNVIVTAIASFFIAITIIPLIIKFKSNRNN